MVCIGGPGIRNGKCGGASRVCSLCACLLSYKKYVSKGRAYPRFFCQFVKSNKREVSTGMQIVYHIVHVKLSVSLFFTYLFVFPFMFD